MTPLELFKIYKAFDEGAGKKVLEDILNYCGMERTTARHREDGQIDPLSMALMEGRRQVGLYIKRKLIEPKEETDE